MNFIRRTAHIALQGGWKSPLSVGNINSFCAGAVKKDIKEKIDEIVKNNKVVVFMKGVPEEPRCGFSNAVVQVLRMHGVQYEAHDVLQDETLRQAVKEYSDWPTIPQVYINGNFVGGCDILLQMHQNGELEETLKKAGIKSAASDVNEENKH